MISFAPAFSKFPVFRKLVNILSRDKKLIVIKIQEGGRRNIFKSVFGMQEKELLLKASQCYLYTTAGPIAGILFVSTAKVAFYSERPITFSSVTGELVRAPYKVGFMWYNPTLSSK